MPTKSKSKVLFFYETETELRNRTKLKKFIESMFIIEKRKLGFLNIIFCSDQALLEINKKYLKHNYNTDIITFELSTSKMSIEAEIYISIDRVKANAKLWGESFNKELHRVVFHGILHLCGYGDKKRQEIKEMRAKEDYYLSRYFK